jgi:TolB-like protein/Tfp pilus assembly protein PilF
MSQPSNKLTNLWQELKRRKVVRVVSVYAAAAFVILELVSIVVEPLKLPEWLLPVVIVLLSVGFIIAVILSWVFDVTPEGIEKTKPSHKIEEADKPVSSNGWKIASYISFIVIIGLIVFNIMTRDNPSNETEILDKSIAVLPFKSLSDDPEKQYLADGAMEAIRVHLSKVEDLRVMSRTSVEQYRVTDKTVSEICQELGVTFLLEGSFQKYEDKARLTAMLVTPGKEGHEWAKEYDRSWVDILSVQSEVAQLIAGELQAVITPQEKQLIEKSPTTSLTAYDFYQRARAEHLKYQLNNNNRKALESAEDFYYRALEYDSTFAQAYTGLALTNYSKHLSTRLYSGFQSDTYFEEVFLDSILILADAALSYDEQLAEAYTVKGKYYSAKGFIEQAIKEFDMAILFNPNDWMAYSGKGHLHSYNDYLKAIENLQKAASLNHGSELPRLLAEIGFAYLNTGFNEKNIFYLQEALKLSDDSAAYYYSLSSSERWLGNYHKANKFGKKVYAIDSNITDNLLMLAYNYMYVEQNEESFNYIKEWIKKLENLGIHSINNMHRIGYIYWLNGYKQEADFYFNEQIKYCNRSNELGRMYSTLYWSYYDLAGIYAFKGEKDMAFKNLRIFNQKQRIGRWMVTLINDDPLFNSIRDETEFQQIVHEVEAKYQAEHERVKKWLEENDML